MASSAVVPMVSLRAHSERGPTVPIARLRIQVGIDLHQSGLLAAPLEPRRPPKIRGRSMALAFADPFDALLRFQRALEQQLDSDWLENTTTGVGAFPPINVFQQGSNFVAIIEMPGVSK